MKFGAILWHTDPPTTRDDVICTVTNGHSRWILPVCKYSPKSGTWWAKVIDEFEMPTDDPEDPWERIDERYEKIDLNVIAWADYPDPYSEDEPDEA